MCFQRTFPKSGNEVEPTGNTDMRHARVMEEMAWAAVNSPEYVEDTGQNDGYWTDNSVDSIEPVYVQPLQLEVLEERPIQVTREEPAEPAQVGGADASMPENHGQETAEQGADNNAANQEEEIPSLPDFSNGVSAGHITDFIVSNFYYFERTARMRDSIRSFRASEQQRLANNGTDADGPTSG